MDILTLIRSYVEGLLDAEDKFIDFTENSEQKRTDRSLKE